MSKIVKVKNDEGTWDEYKKAVDYKIDDVTENLKLIDIDGQVFGEISRSSWKIVIKEKAK